MSRRPPNQAAALEYVPGRDDAPRVVASGAGHIAARIIALADAHGVPIHRDPALVAVLARLDVDSSIPPALYLAVAEVLGTLLRAGLLDHSG